MIRRLVLPSRPVAGSVGEIAALLDVSGEAEIVVADQGARQAGIAVPDRLGHRVAQGGHPGRLLRGMAGQPVDPAHLDPKVLRQVTDHAAAGRADESVVDLHDPVRRFGPVEGLPKPRRQRRDLAVGRAGREKPCRHAFQRRPDDDHVDDLRAGLADHDDAPARHRADEAFVLQQDQRLAHGRAADAQPFGEDRKSVV